MPDRTRISALLAAAAVASGFAAAPGSAAEDELMQRAKEVFQPIPEQPPSLAGNPITPDKVELGKMLFFEPRLSESWMLSCNACHNLATGGVDLQETSIGHGWRKGRATPRLCLTPPSTSPSSGMAGRRTSRSRRPAR